MWRLVLTPLVFLAYGGAFASCGVLVGMFYYSPLKYAFRAQSLVWAWLFHGISWFGFVILLVVLSVFTGQFTSRLRSGVLDVESALIGLGLITALLGSTAELWNQWWLVYPMLVPLICGVALWVAAGIAFIRRR